MYSLYKDQWIPLTYKVLQSTEQLESYTFNGAYTWIITVHYVNVVQMSARLLTEVRKTMINTWQCPFTVQETNKKFFDMAT